MAIKGEKEINIIEGKNIQLIGFDELDSAEMNIINSLLQEYVKKIDNKTDYELLRIKLKIHKKATTFMHELEAELFIHPGMSLGATMTHKNLYRAVAVILKKLISEADHLKKKDPRNHPIRKLSRKVV